MENAFVQYISEDKFFTEFFNHLRHMSVAAGYKANYKFNGQRISDAPLVVKHSFWDSEKMTNAFDLYEGERILSEGGTGNAVRTVQFVVSPKAIKHNPNVKDDLELLCSRIFRQAPKWVSTDGLPMSVPQEKPGCLGYLFDKFVGDF